MTRGTTPLVCDHVEYPNHSQVHQRKKCGAALMKKVKVGGKYKLVPRKVYVYNSLVDSLERLVSKPGFLDRCEQWRKYSKEASREWLTDVYDGNLLKDWLKKNGSPFFRNSWEFVIDD